MLTVTNHTNIPPVVARVFADSLPYGTVFHSGGGLYLRLEGGALRFNASGPPMICDYDDFECLDACIVSDIPVTITVGQE